MPSPGDYDNTQLRNMRKSRLVGDTYLPMPMPVHAYPYPPPPPLLIGGAATAWFSEGRSCRPADTHVTLEQTPPSLQKLRR